MDAPLHSDDCNILVVDDNVDAADTLVTLLGLLGYQAMALYAGKDAVEAAETLHPKLIFLDIDMPGMDGYEAAALIRGAEESCHVELVALTARTAPCDRERCAQVGFDAHVGKPIGFTELQAIAERACPTP